MHFVGGKVNVLLDCSVIDFSRNSLSNNKHKPEVTLHVVELGM